MHIPALQDGEHVTAQFAGLKDVGYEAYQFSGSATQAVPSQHQMVLFVENIAKIAPMNIELENHTVHFIKNDGLELTPEGMAKIFSLIQAVDAIDPPAH